MNVKNIQDKIIVMLSKNNITRKIPIINYYFKDQRKRDYLNDWVKPEGKNYRLGVYERQKKNGIQPLSSNPTAVEIKDVLSPYQPDLVLEAGCGWGRLMEEIEDEYRVEGFDISDDMLKLCPRHLKVFKLDIVKPSKKFLQNNKNHWDVIFTRGVMLYFMDYPDQMREAMGNMLKLAKKKIIFWEWPEVCDRMRKMSKNKKFEYQHIEHRSE